MLGSMTPVEVRRYMESAELLLFTSDQNEGWGAVLNEAMNSGCAVVADNRIGSVPFLMKDSENGYICYSGELDEMYRRVKLVLEQRDRSREIGKNAYKTVLTEWNAETAARRLIEFIEKGTVFPEGPMSRESITRKN